MHNHFSFLVSFDEISTYIAVMAVGFTDLQVSDWGDRHLRSLSKKKKAGKHCRYVGIYLTKVIRQRTYYQVYWDFHFVNKTFYCVMSYVFNSIYFMRCNVYENVGLLWQVDGLITSVRVLHLNVNHKKW